MAHEHILNIINLNKYIQRQYIIYNKILIIDKHLSSTRVCLCVFALSFVCIVFVTFVVFTCICVCWCVSVCLCVFLCVSVCFLCVCVCFAVLLCDCVCL